MRQQIGRPKLEREELNSCAAWVHPLRSEQTTCNELQWYKNEEKIKLEATTQRNNNKIFYNNKSDPVVCPFFFPTRLKFSLVSVTPTPIPTPVPALTPNLTPAGVTKVRMKFDSRKSSFLAYRESCQVMKFTAQLRECCTNFIKLQTNVQTDRVYIHM